ncbi:MAG: acyl-CoA dehydrogenase [Proteobacteria bacterium]|nr:acyl-CoA dehydrogenase [Pseudomonadota bacterium]
MAGAAITVIFVLAVVYLAYRRLPLFIYTLTFSVLFAAYLRFGHPGGIWQGTLWILLALLWLLNVRPLRKAVVSRPFLRAYLRLLPKMSSTEREALEAGTVSWDGELFSGKPDWSKLRAIPPPRLSAEEQAFLAGPCEELCRMLDDFDITHRRGDLPPEAWAFIKSRGFFAMIIGKQYGGLGFSAYAHSCVLVKLASRSVTCASTVAVPNSLGPAELLNHYGTEEQKNHYLPRLARGEDIPCFALTGPRVGSDAAAIPDTGVVCRGMWRGQEVLGLRLNFSKRYITLAPIATVIGLAFRMQDPDRLLGGEVDLGITCALIDRNTPGVEIGKRHLPLNIPFQNGPVRGHDVFVPLDAIIGGVKMAGQGWRMLVEQLSVGRCISLPSNATGGSKAAVFATGAYARIRRQFNMPVGKFEGVELAIARMVGLTYISDAARSVTIAAIDAGARPAVPAGILKYHVTEFGRRVANDAMDVQGGKGIMLGPRNYLGRGYQSIPIAITVEGANILTRSLIIFGQGAIRCHPFVLREMNAARNPDRARGVDEFDRALFGHIGFTISNAARSLVMALTLARFRNVPNAGPTRRYYQHIERFSASFAFATDVAMLALGGYLKKKESISARLGDVLSSLYLASMVLKHHEDQGSPPADLPIVEWSCRELLYQAQEQLHGVLRNFPVRPMSWLMRVFIFPRGLTYFAPGDRLARSVAQLVQEPGEPRDRLTAGVYREPVAGSALGALQRVLELAPLAEPLEKKLRVEGVRTGRITALDLPGQIEQGRALGILTGEEADNLRHYDELVMDIVNVDEFAPDELGTHAAAPSAAH